MKKALTSKQLRVELYKVNYDCGYHTTGSLLNFIVFGVLDGTPILAACIQVQEGEPYSVLYDFAETYGCLYLYNAHGGRQRMFFDPEQVSSAYEDVKSGEINSRLIASSARGDKTKYGFIEKEVNRDRRVEVLANMVYMRWAGAEQTLQAAKEGLFKNKCSEIISGSTFLYVDCPNDKRFYNDKFCEYTCTNDVCLRKATFPQNTKEMCLPTMFEYDFRGDNWVEELFGDLLED